MALPPLRVRRTLTAFFTLPYAIFWKLCAYARCVCISPKKDSCCCELAISGIRATAIFNTGRRYTPTGGERHKQYGRPSKVGDNRRQLAACDVRMFSNEGTVCEGQYMRPLVPRRCERTRLVDSLCRILP
ncbi:unnamed protein product [Ixodes pacificus]